VQQFKIQLPPHLKLPPQASTRP